MTTNTQEQQPLLPDMWYTTPEWLLEEVWVTDDEHTAEQWWNSQHTDCDIPFWVPGVSRGIESPTQYYHLTKVVNSSTYQHHASYLRSTV
jgi:hypothetical protein